MWLHPGQISAGGALPVPAGVIVGYDGTIASLADYPDWLLCDGTNDTPDLTDRFIIGSGEGYSLGDTGGASSGQVTGATSTDGAHGGIGGVAHYAGASGYNTRRGASAGAHSHSVTGDLDWCPPSRQLVFIKANAESALPPGAVAWALDDVAPAGFGEFADAAGRFTVGNGGDGREQVGGDMRAVTNLAVLAAGDHLHPAETPSGFVAGSIILGDKTSGQHTHTAPVGEIIEIPKPPYLVLLCVKSPGGSGRAANLVVAYDGAAETLPAEWHLCDGNDGTPNLGGRIPLGKDGSSEIGDTGGSLDALTITGGSIPSVSASHDHRLSRTAIQDTSGDHSSYAWSHAHSSWTGTADPTPPYHCLHYIMFMGA